MQFIYLGHASFAVKVSGKTLLFDPFITSNPLASDIDIQRLNADCILVSHGHGDHIGDVMEIAGRTGAKIIGGVEVVHWFQRQGAQNVHEMNFGTFDFDFGRLSYVPAAHSSSLPDGSYGGNPGGFVVQTGEGDFYYSGDTSLTADMQMIPHYAPSLKFAVLPIGGNYTMNPAQALIASDLIRCNTVVGVHYNTFPPIQIDTEEAKSLFKTAQKELLLPAIGERLEF